MKKSLTLILLSLVWIESAFGVNSLVYPVNATLNSFPTLTVMNPNISFGSFAYTGTGGSATAQLNLNGTLGTVTNASPNPSVYSVGIADISDGAAGQQVVLTSSTGTGSVPLTNTGGPATMTLALAANTSNSGAGTALGSGGYTFNLDGSGNATLYIGGTLTMPPNVFVVPNVGAYSATFNLIVNYS